MTDRENAKSETGQQNADSTRGLWVVVATLAVLICIAVFMRLDRTELRGGATSGSAAATYHIRIDLNTASEAELQLLPNIGPRLAERIVVDRSNNGSFGSLDDLSRVPGIGPVTVERIAPYVVVDDP